MSDQPKLERLLRLMKMLTGNISYSLPEIADRLEMSERSVFRYINTFREAGFVVKRKGNIYKLDKSSPHFKDISKLLHFSEEESHILKSAIDSIDENNLLKQNLKRKLATVYDYKILAKTIIKSQNAANISNIIEAVENKKQILLKNYSSANSNIVRDRIVEAFEFTTNYIQIWAYEPESKANKLFKVSRIGLIEILDIDWKKENEHKSGFVDIFRISSFNQKTIKLKMGVRATMLLKEEYPLAEKDIKQIDSNKWMLETKLSSYEGVARFIMGLLSDIEIIDSEDLQDFIRAKLQNYSSNY